MIPSLHELSVQPRDLFNRETRGMSQQQMVELRKRDAQSALQLAIRKLIAFDVKLTDAAHDRARDDDYSSFKLVFTPIMSELIFDFRTPNERRESFPAMRLEFKMKPSNAMRSYMTTTPRMALRQELGELCTTVMSEAFSCLGIFNTKMIPLFINDPAGTISITDVVNSHTNDYWPNIQNLYERVSNRSMRVSKLPKLAGLNAVYLSPFLSSFVYELR